MDERREYWTSTMDRALGFMIAANEVEIAECREPLVDLASCSQEGVEWKVAESALGELGAAFIRESLVSHFAVAALHLNRQGLTPTVMYAYRTPAMQRSLLTSDRVLDQVVERVLWETGPAEATPERAYERLVVLCANSLANGTHLAGTALDVAIYRTDGSGQVDLGGDYLLRPEEGR